MRKIGFGLVFAMLIQTFIGVSVFALDEFEENVEDRIEEIITEESNEECIEENVTEEIIKEEYEELRLYSENNVHTITSGTAISAVLVDEAVAEVGEESVKIKDNGYAAYALNASSQGVYALKVKAASADKAAKLEVLLDDEKITSTDIKNTLSESDFLEYFVVGILIPEGSHRLMFKVSGGSMNLESIIFGDLEVSDAANAKSEFTLNAVDYIKDGQGISFNDSTPNKLDQSYFIESYFPVEVWGAGHGYIVYSDASEWYTFNAGVPETGTYDVYVHIATISNVGISVTGEDGKKQELGSATSGSWDTYKEVSVGSVNLTQGDQVIRVNIESGGGNITYYRFVKKIDKPELYAMKSGNDILVKGSEIKRGSEEITAYFTDDLDTSSKVDVQLTDGEKVIATDYEISDNKVMVILLDTLEYEKEYTIKISNITSVTGGSYSMDTPISFKTCSEANDEGTGKFKSASASAKNNVFKLEGVVTTLSGIVMPGRSVYATFANGTTYTSNSVYSGENGKFELTYELPEDAKEGTYEVVLYTDYISRGNRKKFSVIYMSATTELEILNAVNESKTWEDVKKVLENDRYYKILGLSGSSYLSALDNERFYKHFIGNNYTEKDEIIADYDKFLAFERINQEQNVSAITKLLKDSAICTTLGIDRGKVLLLKNTGNDFYNAVIELELHEDADKFVEKVNDMINDYILIEYDIVIPELLANNVSSYVGKAKEVSIGFKDTLDKVSKVDYTIICPDEEIIKKIDFKDLNVTKVNNIIYVTSENGESITFEVLSGETGKYELKVSAVVEFNISSSETCVVEAPETNFTLQFTKNSSSGTSGGSSSGGGKTSFSPVTVPSNPITPDNGNKDDEQNNNKFNGFSDIADAKWAEENVNRLVEKNVISKSDKFRPNDYITREEFVKMAVVAFNLYDENAKADFTDVKSDAWYAPYVASAYVKGIVTGNPDGSFGVGKNITRQEMAVILGRVLNSEYSDEISEKFVDDSAIADWAKSAVYEMKKRGIINGVGENMFEPESNATRAMAARMIDFMMNEVAK